MDTNRWARIEALFFAALDVRSDARVAWLADLIAAEPDVAREVTEMLDAHFEAPPLRIEAVLDGPQDPAGRGSTPTLAPGSRLGPYRIEGLLGMGGMAEVYRAERVDGLYRQTVALKVMRPGYHAAEFVRLFASERQILARLQHPAIAALLGGGTTPAGVPYLAMQLVVGLPITRHCSERGVSLRDRMRLFVRVCEAVQYAHARLIVHRDLKASNILVTPAGEPMLLDFGIAKLLAPDPDDAFYAPTRPGVNILTPEHAAPEQLTGGSVTTATDVYALGLLLFELLTDRRPFETTVAGSRTLPRSVVEADLPAPSSVVEDRNRAARLSGDLDRIVARALRAEPSERYTSAGQLADDVERHLDGLPVRAQPDSARYRAGKFARRHRGKLTTAAGIVLLLVASTAASLVQARRVSAERDVAESQRAQSDAVVGLLTSLFESSNPRLVPGADTLRISAFLEQAEREVERLGDQPSLQAGMWQVLGRMHMARSRFDRAVSLFERSHALHVELSGPDDDESARAEHQLAMATLALEGPGKAVPLLRASSDRLAHLLGSSHSDAVTALQDLAVATDDIEERARLLDRVVELRSGKRAEDSVATAALLNARASDHMERSQYREALTLFERSGAILDRALGPEHPNRLTVAGNTVAALTRLALYDRAEPLARSVLEARVRVLGPEAQEVAIARENLAITLAGEGRLAEAEALLRDALTAFERLVAPRHWRTRNTLRNLGLVVALRGSPEAGLLLLDSAIVGGPDAPDIDNPDAYMRGQRALLLLRLGRAEEAGPAARGAAEAVNRTTPDGHVYRADVAVLLGLVALARGRAEEAEREFLAARTILEPMLPPGHPLLSQAACGLAISRVSGSRSGPEEADEAGRQGPCAAYARWGLADPLLLQWATGRGPDPGAGAP